MKGDRGLRRVVVAVTGMLVTFCLVATTIYYKMADVAVNGFVHGGGLAALVVLILLLRLS
jgi:hypothetical protein